MHICSVENCERPVEHKTKGWCDMHYRRWRRHGDPTIKKVKPKTGCICEIEGCNRPVKGDGLCNVHWCRRKRHGDPLGGGRERGWVLEWIKENSSYQGEECLIWPHYVNTNGYGQVSYKGSRTTASRLMCLFAHGEPPQDGKFYEAAHSCGKGHEGCVNPNHLRWATFSENAEDKIKHGTLLFGENAPHAKLSNDDVREIRRRLERGDIQKDIAADYDMDPSSVTKIKKGKLWSRVK